MAMHETIKNKMVDEEQQKKELKSTREEEEMRITYV
jgi:hypothetical protein